MVTRVMTPEYSVQHQMKCVAIKDAKIMYDIVYVKLNDVLNKIIHNNHV